MDLEKYEQEFTPEQQFDSHLSGLMMEWRTLGIHPDDMITCAICHEFLVDPDNNFEPSTHCVNTTYIIRTASGIDYAMVRPGQGGFQLASKVAKEIRGRLFGVDLEGKEVRIAFYDLVPPKELGMLTDECDHQPDEGCYRCCRLCNIDRHVCPGCGGHIPHEWVACRECLAEHQASTPSEEGS